MTRHRSPQLPGVVRRPRSVHAEDSAADVTQRVRRLATEGAHLLASKRPAEAAVFLVRAWELDPHDASIAINLGGAYILQGKHKQAIPILEAASHLEPNNPMVWTNLAAAYLGKLPLAGPEEQEQAIAAYEKVLVLDPKAPHVHYNLGLIYLDRHDTIQASLHFMNALAVDPNDRDAQLWLDRIGRGEFDAHETVD